MQRSGQNYFKGIFLILVLGATTVYVWLQDGNHRAELLRLYTGNITQQLKFQIQNSLSSCVGNIDRIVRSYTARNKVADQLIFQDFVRLLTGIFKEIRVIQFCDGSGRTVFSSSDFEVPGAVTNVSDRAEPDSRIGVKTAVLMPALKAYGSKYELIAVWPAGNSETDGFVRIIADLQNLIETSIPQGADKFAISVMENDAIVYKAGTLPSGGYDNPLAVADKISLFGREYSLKVCPGDELAGRAGYLSNFVVLGVGIFITLGMAIIVVRHLRDQIEHDRFYQGRLKALASRIWEVQEDERSKISSVLHDELGHELSLARLELENLDLKEDGLLKSSVEQVLKRMNSVLRHVRNLASSLRPPVLDDFGFVDAADVLLKDFQDSSKIETAFRHDQAKYPLSKKQELCMYRVLQESLTNVSKYARATKVDVSIESGDSAVKMCVKDDGMGFDMLQENGTRGTGLLGMEERVEKAGGRFEVRSTQGRGTEITVNINTAAKGNGV